MKRLLYIAFMVLSVALAGCNKDDDDSGTIEFETDGLFVENYGDTTSTTFDYWDVASLGVLSKPTGWDVSLSLANRTITVTAPADAASGDAYGSITLYGFTPKGSAVADYVKVGVIEFIDLEAQGNGVQANCFVATEVNKMYTFNPKKRGNENYESLDTSYCEILWRTSGKPIGYLQEYADNKIGFYVNSDESDYDYDDDEDEIVEGNAVIAAYNSSDEIIWSWHVWVTADTADTNTFSNNGYEFMNRNLGAFTNSNVEGVENIGTGYRTDLDKYDYDDQIARSYGLYYQWGRKDPFIYPSAYNAASGYDRVIFDEDGIYVPHEFEEITSETGSIPYSIEYPNTFIIEGHDWLTASHNSLWGYTTSKSLYDPCPRGWRVPDAEAFSGISWDDNADDLEWESYGAYLSGELFMGLGMRGYLTGTTQNTSSDSTFQLWSGYYWSNTPVDSSKTASALHFYLDNTTEPKSVIVNSSAAVKRGNALQIRCVRDN